MLQQAPCSGAFVLRNMQKVDNKACLEPVEEGDAPALWEPNDVLYNHTELGTHV